MRILHVTKYAAMRGGIERYIADLSSHQLEQGHHVEVLGVQEVSDDWIPASRRRLPRAQFTFASAPLSVGYVGEYRRAASAADVVHFHYPNPISELSRLLAGNAGRVHVATYHADISRAKPLARLYTRMARRFLEGLDGIIATSEALRSRAPELRGLEAITRIIPLGVDTGRFAGSRLTDGTSVLFVGRLIPYKGVNVLVEAIAQNPALRLTIVGDGPLRSEIEALVGQLGIGHRVTLAGRVNDAALLELYRSADVFVLPSINRGEAFGYVLLEAMAAGCAVISTEVGSATSWVNQSGATGLVVAPGAPEALAGALRAMFANAELLKLMQAAAVRRANEFHVDVMRKATDDYYADMLASTSGRHRFGSSSP